ncbi:MAG: ribosome assembly RNA-binding protein YhbY [Gammaproteobacteria bacterium]|nr:ribosome assembly RNA-binding protein YhbY [Gammaproteobacteria bacterium]
MLNKQKLKFLRSLAHEASPIIWIGQHGLSANVQEELQQALDHHELVKIKLRVGERNERDTIAQSLCDITGAEVVQKIGNTLTVYRANKKEARISFPKS